MSEINWDLLKSNVLKPPPFSNIDNVSSIIDFYVHLTTFSL